MKKGRRVNQEHGLTFARLPLTEVSLRLAPSRPIALDPVSLSEIVAARPNSDWNARHIKKPYDGFGRACIPITGESFGVELLSPDGSVVIVLQANLLQVFWRNYNLKPDRRYPGFSELSGHLDKMAKVVQDLRPSDEDEEASALLCAANLRYTNFVATETAPTGSDLQKYIKKVYLPKFKSRQIVHEVESCWRADDGTTDVRLHVQVGATKEHDFGFEIITSAGHFFESNEPIEEISKDHAFLLSFFKEVVTESSLEEWGYIP